MTVRSSRLATGDEGSRPHIKAIRASQRLTQHALDCKAGDVTTCPNFHDLVAETTRCSRQDRATIRTGTRAHFFGLRALAG